MREGETQRRGRLSAASSARPPTTTAAAASSASRDILSTLRRGHSDNTASASETPRAGGEAAGGEDDDGSIGFRSRSDSLSSRPRPKTSPRHTQSSASAPLTCGTPSTTRPRSGSADEEFSSPRWRPPPGKNSRRRRSIVSMDDPPTAVVSSMPRESGALPSSSRIPLKDDYVGAGDGSVGDEVSASVPALEPVCVPAGHGRRGSLSLSPHVRDDCDRLEADACGCCRCCNGVCSGLGKVLSFLTDVLYQHRSTLCRWFVFSVTCFVSVGLVALVLLQLTNFISCPQHPNYLDWTEPQRASVKASLMEIDEKLDHINMLMTNDTYLGKKRDLFAFRHRRDVQKFTFQIDELNRTEEAIHSVRQRLLALSAVLDNTTLTCDWLDEEKWPFEAAHPDKRRGCHTTSEQHYSGCFDGEGQPQGCHLLVKRKVSRLQFISMCGEGSFVSSWHWGWCRSSYHSDVPTVSSALGGDTDAVAANGPSSMFRSFRRFVNDWLIDNIFYIDRTHQCTSLLTWLYTVWQTVWDICDIWIWRWFLNPKQGVLVLIFSVVAGAQKLRMLHDGFDVEEQLKQMGKMLQLSATLQDEKDDLQDWGQGLLNISLNVMYEDPSSPGQYVFGMRTLGVHSLETFFVNSDMIGGIGMAKDLIVQLIEHHRASSADGVVVPPEQLDEVNDFYPVLQLAERERRQVKLHVQNKVSGLVAGWHLSRDLGKAIAPQGKFVHALTWECPDDDGQVQDKYRIMLVSEPTLRRIRDTPVDSMRMEAAGNKYYKTRYQHLQTIADMYYDKAGIGATPKILPPKQRSHSKLSRTLSSAVMSYHQKAPKFPVVGEVLT